MKLLYELSGDNLAIAAAEIACVGEITEQANGIAIAETKNPDETTRLAETHVVSELLGVCGGTADDLKNLLQTLNITAEKPYCCRARKIHPAIVDLSQLELEKMMGSCITGKVSLKNPEIEYRAVFSDGKCWFGRVIHKIDRGSYAERNPDRRAYFHPGVIMPLLARAIVNLTRVKPGESLLDPFCGTGGVLLECRILGVDAVGSDYDIEMLTGCRQNIPDGLLLKADATNMPYLDETFHAVAADLPYGQSTSIGADSLEALYRGSFAEIYRVLQHGGRAVIVTHKDIRHILPDFDFELEGYFEQYVHKSLTRKIHVLKKS